MTIKDARALTYQQMASFKEGKPIQLFSQNQIHPHNSIRVISILNPEQPEIYSHEDVLRANGRLQVHVFKDIEPVSFAEQAAVNFVPPADHFYMTREQARKIVKMIREAQASNEEVFFLVHCTHGMCRSGAVVDFIFNVCGLGYWNCKNSNPQIVPNHWVQRLLFQEWFSNSESSA